MANLDNGNDSYLNTSKNTNDHLQLKITKWILYAAIFCVSSVGNTLVCIIVLKKKRMKTVTNYFILNLAVADLTLTLICIPFDIPVQEMGHVWPYGAFMCKILYPLQTMCLCASVFTLTAVSVTRYWAITHPFRNQLTTKQAKWIISCIWLLSIIPVSPYMYVLNLERGECQETSWKRDQHRKGYTLALFIMEYIIPLSVIAVSYILIGYELNKHSNPDHQHIKTSQSDETAKVVRMLIVVTTVFAVCVLPNNVMWLWLDFGTGGDFVYFWEVVAFCNVLTFSNSAANPICYTIFNEHYRKEFKNYFRHLCGQHSGSASDSIGGETWQLSAFSESKRSRSTHCILLQRH